MPQLTVAENVFLGARAARRRASSSGGKLDAGVRRARGRVRRLRAARRHVGRPAADGGAAEGRDPARALARRAELIVMDEPTAALERARDAAAARDHPRARARRDDDPPHLALPARGARARRHGHRAARRPARQHRRRPRTETEASLVEAMLGRPLTSTFPAKAARRSRRARSCSRCAASRAPGVDDASVRPPRGRDPRPRRARRRRTHRARARALRRRARAVGRRSQLDGGRVARPQPAPQPRRGPRDDPRVAQGRRPDLRALVDRERDALAARRRSAPSASSAARCERRAGARPCSTAATCAARRYSRAGARALGRQPAEGAARADAAVRSRAC